MTVELDGLKKPHLCELVVFHSLHQCPDRFLNKTCITSALAQIFGDKFGDLSKRKMEKTAQSMSTKCRGWFIMQSTEIIWSSTFTFASFLQKVQECLINSKLDHIRISFLTDIQEGGYLFSRNANQDRLHRQLGICHPSTVYLSLSSVHSPILYMSLPLIVNDDSKHIDCA